MSDKDFQFNEAMNELESINEWFQDEEIDLEEGLKKLRRGKTLITQCQQRLKQIENEFTEIKDSFETDNSTPASSGSDEELPF